MKRTSKILASYLSIFILIWTSIPSFFNSNLPLDVIEHLAYGPKLEFGYWKHPYLLAWLTNIANLLSPGNGWTIYLISTLMVSLGLIFLYHLARERFDENQSLAIVLLTSGIYYFTYPIPEFNQNILLLSLWPIATYFGYRVTFDDRLKNWVFLGIAVGLLSVSKYFSIVWFIGYCLYTLQKSIRPMYRNYKLYIATLVAFVFLLPNLYWQWKHQFIGIDYALSRLKVETPTLWSHFSTASNFSSAQLADIALCLLLFYGLTFKGLRAIKASHSQKAYDRFILYMFYIPLIATLSIPLLSGEEIKQIWGTPLWDLLPIYLFIKKPVSVSLKQVKILFYTASSILLIIGVAYAIFSDFYILDKKGSRTLFPGNELATKAYEFWIKNEGDKPKMIVGGDVWLAGNVAYYGTPPESQRPFVFIDLNNLTCPRLTTIFVQHDFLAISLNPCNNPPSHFLLKQQTEITLEKKIYCLQILKAKM